MKANEFIKEHIKVDERSNISKKILYLTDKYKEFVKCLEILQKRDASIILFVLSRNSQICYKDVKDDIKNCNYNKWINYLIVEDFIQRDEEENLQEGVGAKPLVYTLTPKGQDFLLIDYINEFFKEEFKYD